MKVAFISGCIGVGLCFWISEAFHLPALLSLKRILTANLSGILSLLLVLQLENRFKQKPKNPLRGNGRMWTVLSLLYWGLIVLVDSDLKKLQGFKIFCYQSFPLLLSSGFCLFPFGWIQDQIVAKKQRQENEKQKEYKTFSEQNLSLTSPLSLSHSQPEPPRSQPSSL